MAGLDRIKKRSVRSIKPLVTVTAETVIVNSVCIVAVMVGIARVDASKIGEQRDQLSVALVDAVSDLVNVRNVVPGQDVAIAELVQVHIEYCTSLDAGRIGTSEVFLFVR